MTTVVGVKMALWQEAKFTKNECPMLQATKPFNVVVIQPLGYVHSSAFREMAEYLQASIKRCGFRSYLARNEIRPDCHNVVLGAHLLTAIGVDRLPHDSIVFNTEQLDDGNAWHFASGHYAALLNAHHVWDYSLNNLKRIGHNQKSYIPFWFCEALIKTPKPATARRGPLLFYGALTLHRKRILRQLQNKGVQVETLFGVYGRERDQKMWEAWAVLNLHKSEETGIFEPVRCFYPLINRVAVISEASCGDPTADDFRDAMFFLEQENFVEQVLRLYRDREVFCVQSQRHFDNFSKKEPRPLIEKAIEQFLASL